MKLGGGCHCGSVRYAADAPTFHETTCYCVDCRRISGAVGVAWFSVKRARFAWVGHPSFYRSSREVIRRFCANCGTTLSYENDALPDELDVTVASLDDPGLVAPKDHVWVQQKPDWMRIGDKLPQFGRRRK